MGEDFTYLKALRASRPSGRPDFLLKAAGGYPLNNIVDALCEKYNICIQNGDKIPYVYKNKTYTYIIDFKLPDLKYNIEIKDNHIWHREQVESGKWQAKFEYANQHSKEQGFIYKVLFPDEIESFVESLLKR